MLISVEFQSINEFCNRILSTFGIQKNSIINLIYFFKMNALLTFLLLMTNFICQIIIDLVTWVTGLFS